MRLSRHAALGAGGELGPMTGGPSGYELAVAALPSFQTVGAQFAEANVNFVELELASCPEAQDYFSITRSPQVTLPLTLTLTLTPTLTPTLIPTLTLNPNPHPL